MNNCSSFHSISVAHGSSQKSDFTTSAARTAIPLFAEFQINRFTDLGRSTGTEAPAKAEQVSIAVLACDGDFSSRKQAGIAEHGTRVFQKVSTDTQKSIAQFAADLAQLRGRIKELGCTALPSHIR